MACAPEREALLQSQGWTKQFMADEPRLSEAVEVYKELGFEVHLEAVDPRACQGSDGCNICFQQPEVAAKFKMIFTRPRQASPRSDDLL